MEKKTETKTLSKKESASILTKREYVAAMAMQGLLANPEPFKPHSDISIEKLAIDYADRLLEELTRQELLEQEALESFLKLL